MRRRALLSLCAVVTVGCVGSQSPNNDAPQNSTTDGDHDESTRENIRNWYLLARWVEEAPTDVTPRPSDEPPASDFEVVLEVFDRAADRPESDPPDDSQRHVSYGGGVSKQISTKTKEEIEREFSDIEEYKSYSRDLYYPTGRYFDHEGTIIALQISRPD